MKYRLTEKIGSGGMAEVFRAVAEGPEGFQRAFVIKRIHPRLSEAPDFVRMFVDEATISARLIHPNIVQVFEFAYQDSGYYIVMEPVEGMDMAELLRDLERRREVPPPAFVAEVGRQACRGLEFAHTLAGADGKPLGIVHRDVTPPNIMVAWNGAVKILDFGIARAVQELRTNQSDAGIVKGKISYVAPELLEGRPADARSDIFSLGIVLHELLCGRRLFIGDNDLATLKKVQEMPIEPPSARNPGVKPPLDRIVMRALARDPEKRFQTARELGDELEGVTVRERYSTRAFSKKARELAPQVERRVVVEVAATLGENDAKIVADPSLVRRPTVPPVPPPLPAAAVAGAAAAGAGAAGAGAGAGAAAAGAAVVATRVAGAKLPRWVWLACGSPLALAVVVLIVALRRPAAPPAAAAMVPSAPQSWTTHVSLDSIPQGAAVTIVPAPGAEPRRFGETPVVLDLLRGRTPVELLLTKPGFTPVTFKVIPDHDKDAVAPLERLTIPAVTVAPKPRKLAPASRPPLGAAGRSHPDAPLAPTTGKRPDTRPPAVPAGAPVTAKRPDARAPATPAVAPPTRVIRAVIR